MATPQRSPFARAALAGPDSSRTELVAGLVVYLTCGVLAVLGMSGEPWPLQVLVGVSVLAVVLTVVRTVRVLVTR